MRQRTTAARIASAILIALGLASIALGLISTRLWRGPNEIVATTPGSVAAGGTDNVVITDPGVLNLVADNVHIRASVPDDAPVALVLGREGDIAGWLGEAGATRVTGLTDWETLAVATTDAVDGGEAAPSPIGSDLWLAEDSGTGTVEMDWQAVPGRWSVLAVGGTAANPVRPTLQLTWPVTPTTPWLWPLVGAGLALTALGTAIALFSPRRTVPVVAPVSAPVREVEVVSVPVPVVPVAVPVVEEPAVVEAVGEASAVAPVSVSRRSRRELHARPIVVAPTVVEEDVEAADADAEPVIVEAAVVTEPEEAAEPVVVEVVTEPDEVAEPVVAVVVEEGVGETVEGGEEDSDTAAEDAAAAEAAVVNGLLTSSIQIVAPAYTSRRQVREARRIAELTGALPIIPPVLIADADGAVEEPTAGDGS